MSLNRMGLSPLDLSLTPAFSEKITRWEES
jgi:hypothetical protein